MVKKRLTISNRTTYTLITIGIILLLGIGVYAIPGAVPNPGHSLSQLQACSPGETIVTNSSGQWACATANGSGGGSNGTSYWLQGFGSSIYYSAGNVGINNNFPLYNLDVNGSLSAKTIYLNGYPLSSIYDQSISTDGTIIYSNVAPYNSSGMLQWTNLGNVINFVTDANNNNAPSGVYTPSSVAIKLNPNRAVLGIRISGYVDDYGYCVAGIPGYYAAGTSRYAFSDYNNLGIQPWTQIDITSSTLNVLNDHLLTSSVSDGAGSLSPSTNIFSEQTDGPQNGFVTNSDVGAWTTNKAIGLTAIPPGQTLIVEAKLYNKATGPRQISCDVQILYSSTVPQVTVSNNNYDLIYQQHNSAQCTSAGGSVVAGGTDVNGAQMCRFSNTGCPTGWTQLYSYTTTSSQGCQGQDYTSGQQSCSLSTTTCTTGSHAWGNTPVESCTFYDLYDGPQGCVQGADYCSASVTQVGCF